MILKRYRGDTYPIVATLKVNNVAKDLTGATITFSYVSSSQAKKTITGVISDALSGEVMFIPGSEDFQVAGTYNYDIQYRLEDLIVTYDVGTVVLKKDI